LSLAWLSRVHSVFSRNSMKFSKKSIPVMGAPVAESSAQEHAIRMNSGALLKSLSLDPKLAPYEIRDMESFPMLVPESYCQRIRSGDWDDPLLRQVLPRAEEMLESEGFSNDPVGDAQVVVVPGLLHKYHGRVLLLVSDRCAMHCRFCFRRNTRLPEEVDWDRVWGYVAADTSLNEVILSGGDPLCLESKVLSAHLERVAVMPNIRTVRIHTRLPVADPGLVDAAMIAAITRFASIKTCIVVIHANHAAELSGACPAALDRLRSTRAMLLNQSVLLKGVNDSAEALEALSRALIDHRVLPYYLHQLDRVNGARHFEVEEERGRSLMQDLRRRLPGYAVPRYVREVAGEKAKQPL
jgi:EF-P beta-lysylation protein EpmB